MIGSAIYGYPCEISKPSMIYFALTTEILALILLFIVVKSFKNKR
jgi:hypothetical protein